MSKIYLVRHAESIANTQGIYQGQSYDTDLSPLGYSQAQRLAKYLSDHSINRIYSSPLTRTLKTAYFVSTYHGIPVQTESAIIESNHGTWEGKSKNLIAQLWPHIYQTWLKTPSQAVFPGGETFVQTQSRVLSWWKKATALPGNTLVVTHDNVVRIILAHLFSESLDSIWKYDLHPAGINIIDLENKQTAVSVLNDIQHLENYLTDVSNHAL